MNSSKSANTLLCFTIGCLVMLLIASIVGEKISVYVQKKKGCRTDYSKAMWPSQSLLPPGVQAEALMCEKLGLRNIFFDHTERVFSTSSWTCINATYRADREVWVPSDTHPHIDYTLALFDKGDGGRFIFRQNKARSRTVELILGLNEAVCFEAGPDNEFKLEGSPIFFHFRTKLEKPLSKSHAFCERYKHLKNL